MHYGPLDAREYHNRLIEASAQYASGLLTHGEWVALLRRTADGIEQCTKHEVIDSNTGLTNIDPITGNNRP